MTSTNSPTEIQLGVYEHYRNKQHYLVTGYATLESDESQLVLYVPLYQDDKGLGRIWAREINDFTAEVEHEGQTVPRFRYVGKM